MCLEANGFESEKHVGAMTASILFQDFFISRGAVEKGHLTFES